MDEIVVFITASDEEEASKIARALVEERLAGCVNIIKDIRSIYNWQGKIEDEKEVFMVVKTQKPLFDSLIKRVKELQINCLLLEISPGDLAKFFRQH